MRPVRFVALSEDGHALVLADEVGRLLALPLDDRVSTVLHPDGSGGPGGLTAASSDEPYPALSPSTSRPGSAPGSRPTTWPASPGCRWTGCCATPDRSFRSGRCSPSTPGVPG